MVEGDSKAADVLRQDARALDVEVSESDMTVPDTVFDFAATDVFDASADQGMADGGGGALDFEDNCPSVANPEQDDAGGDETGDACETDKDGDGWGDAVDCLPLDPAGNSGAVEVCDGKDNDSNGEIDEGFTDSACGGPDCDDSNEAVKPDPAGGCALGVSCADIVANGLEEGDGDYYIDPDGWDAGSPPLEVYCNMTIEGGGWRRIAHDKCFGARDNQFVEWSTGFTDSGNQEIIGNAQVAGFSNCVSNHSAWYSMSNYCLNSPYLVHDYEQGYNFQAGSYRFWFGEDLHNHTEGDNTGTVCVDFYVK